MPPTPSLSFLSFLSFLSLSYHHPQALQAHSKWVPRLAIFIPFFHCSSSRELTGIISVGWHFYSNYLWACQHNRQSSWTLDWIFDTSGNEARLLYVYFQFKPLPLAHFVIYRWSSPHNEADRVLHLAENSKSSPTAQFHRHEHAYHIPNFDKRKHWKSQVTGSRRNTSRRKLLQEKAVQLEMV
jgi:hypothetical protein